MRGPAISRRRRSETPEPNGDGTGRHARSSDQPAGDIGPGVHGALDLLNIYFGDIKRIRLLTFPGEQELAQRVQRGDRRARDHLIEANLRLVASIARYYTWSGLPLADLIQEGSIGLLRAAELFDWRRGHKFSSYATWWIRQAIQRAVATQVRIIRLPVHFAETAQRLRQARAQLLGEHGNDPTAQELSQQTGINGAMVEVFLRVDQPIVSLDEPCGDGLDGPGAPLAAFLPAVDEAPEQRVFDNWLRAQVWDLLDTLPARERYVLTHRFGLNRESPKVLEEIGGTLGVTRERVRQLEQQALQRLRSSRATERLRGTLGESGGESGSRGASTDSRPGRGRLARRAPRQTPQAKGGRARGLRHH